jgi:hypothetical protein
VGEVIALTLQIETKIYPPSLCTKDPRTGNRSPDSVCFDVPAEVDLLTEIVRARESSLLEASLGGRRSDADVAQLDADAERAESILKGVQDHSWFVKSCSAWG